MKKTGITILSLIMIFTVIYSCSTNEKELNSTDEINLVELQQNLLDFKNKLNSKKISADSLIISIEEVKTSFNDYDNLGIEYIEFLNNLKQLNSKIEVDNYISENINSFNSFNLELNDAQTIIIESFYKDKTNDNYSVLVAKEYEIFVKDNFIQGTNDYNELLSFLSFNKWLFYDYIYLAPNKENNSASKEWICARRECFDCCMYNKINNNFADANVVDYIQFAISAAETVAWWAGSCTWDCW